MNAKTLEKLKNNPHYKISAKQYAESQEAERAPMVEFGVVPKNTSTFTPQITRVKRVGRVGKHEKKQ